MNPFIVIEALDAGGSQTQTDRLVSRLKKEKYSVHQYHFPQEHAATGRFIYEKYLHAMNRGKFSKREQALAYIQDFYSRADEIESIITKSKGRHIIVSDRFYQSTMAYQTINLSGYDRKKMLKWIKWLCEEGTLHLPKPSLVVLLDTPVDISLNHLKTKKKDFHENKEKLSSFRRSYVRLAKEEKWTVINSVNDQGEQRSIADIHAQVWESVQRIL